MTGSKRSWTDEDLIVAVKSSDSYAETLRKLGISVKAGNYKTIQKYIKILEIDVSHFSGQSWVKTRGSGQLIRYKDGEVFVKDSNYPTHHLRKRLVDSGLVKNKCFSCGIDSWLGQKITLEVDHINGISNDHTIKNLRLLCPNCHSLTPTWRGRNKTQSPL